MALLGECTSGVGEGGRAERGEPSRPVTLQGGGGLAHPPGWQHVASVH